METKQGEGAVFVTEKKKQQSENYEPTISVSTKKADNKISITVKDNGNGIPKNIVDKIFHPIAWREIKMDGKES